MNRHLQTGGRNRQVISGREQVMLAMLLLGILAAVTATILLVSMPAITAVTAKGDDPATAIRSQEQPYPAGFEQVQAAANAAVPAESDSQSRESFEQHRLKAQQAETEQKVPVLCDGECLLMLQQQMQDLGEQVRRAW